MNEADANRVLESLVGDERKDYPSASSWRRRELCAGSFQLEQEAERLGQTPIESADAASGTKIHKAFAGEKVELSEKEETTAQFLVERAQDQVERIFAGKPHKVLKEKRLWLMLQGENGPIGLSGRFDAVYYNDELALLQDFKTGWTEPDAAEDNAQLKVLAVLVGLNLPTVREVIVQIISGPYGITEARYDSAKLARAYDDIVYTTLRAIYEPDAPLSPSPEACKHCKAILICHAVAKLRPVAKYQMEELPAGGEKAAKILDEIEVLSAFIKETKAWYKVKFEADPTYKIPGYEIVPGNIIREVTDWDAARARLAEFLDVSQLNSAADYRLGELEKALGKVVNLKGKDLRERMNSILTGLYVEKQNAGSLKRTK